MGRTARQWVWFVLFVLGGGAVAPSSAAQDATPWNPNGSAPKLSPPWLLKKVPLPVELPRPQHHLLVGLLAVEIHAEALVGADDEQLQVPLDEDTNVVLIRDEVRTLEDGLVWVGHIQGQTGSSAIFSLVREGFAGKITTARHEVFAIHPAAAGIGWVIQLNPWGSESLSDLQPPPATIALDALSRPCGATDPPTDIDALVVYTAEARDPYGTGTDKTPSDMEAWIQLIIGDTNTAFAQSGVYPRLRLAQAEEVVYTESNDVQVDLDALETHGDGLVDNVHALRNVCDADVVFMLIGHAATYNGQANTMLTISPSFAPQAFAVVVDWAAELEYALSHELGHLMGAAHRCGEGGDDGATDYSHGFSRSVPDIAGAGWRTIMAEDPAYPRINYFSTPVIKEPASGLPLGEMTDTCQADNVRVLNDSALTVANFRCGTSTASDVWMRDSWNDTGLEPDPAASADLMWDSPYIWVRATQDANLEHVHEHQNPVAGSTNWIYVKLHNGLSTITDGHLELHWTSAETSSQWPAGWNPLPPVPVTSFLAHSTRIVEVPWSGLPGPGLYCLAAHWNSPADPTIPLATSNMEPQVRKSNNLIWKNLTIMSLSSILDSNNFSFDVIPPIEHGWHPSQPTTITIRPPATATRSFTDLGRVLVRLDTRLMNAWERGGSESTGVEPVEDGLLINDPTGAVLRNIIFTTPGPAQMSLEFSRRTKTPPGRYRIDVRQVSKNLGVGGLSFEIRVPPN